MGCDDDDFNFLGILYILCELDIVYVVFNMNRMMFM